MLHNTLFNHNLQIILLSYQSDCQTSYIRRCQVDRFISDSKYRPSPVRLFICFILYYEKN